MIIGVVSEGKENLLELLRTSEFSTVVDKDCRRLFMSEDDLKRRDDSGTEILGLVAD